MLFKHHYYLILIKEPYDSHTKKLNICMFIILSGAMDPNTAHPKAIKTLSRVRGSRSSLLWFGHASVISKVLKRCHQGCLWHGPCQNKKFSLRRNLFDAWGRCLVMTLNVNNAKWLGLFWISHPSRDILDQGANHLWNVTWCNLASHTHLRQEKILRSFSRPYLIEFPFLQLRAYTLNVRCLQCVFSLGAFTQESIIKQYCC